MVMTTQISLHFGKHMSEPDDVLIQVKGNGGTEWVNISRPQEGMAITIFCDPGQAQEFAARLNYAFDLLRWKATVPGSLGYDLPIDGPIREEPLDTSGKLLLPEDFKRQANVEWARNLSGSEPAPVILDNDGDDISEGLTGRIADFTGIKGLKL